MCTRVIGQKSLILAALFMGWGTPAAAEVRRGVNKWLAGDYEAAVSEWKAPANSGDPDAQFNLAQAYKLGRGVPADVDMAIKLYTEAAKKGHPRAVANLGPVLLEKGQHAAAIPYLRRAAAAGDAANQYLLGAALFNGDGILRDYVEAYAWMQRSKLAGFPEADAALAEMRAHLTASQLKNAVVLSESLMREQVNLASGTHEGPPEQRGGGSWRVQLGAFSRTGAAEEHWKLLSKSRSSLAALKPVYVNRKEFVRLQAGPLLSAASARRVCTAIIASGSECFPVKI